MPNSCTLVRIMDLNQYLEKMITNTIVIWIRPTELKWHKCIAQSTQWITKVHVKEKNEKMKMVEFC